MELLIKFYFLIISIFSTQLIKFENIVKANSIISNIQNLSNLTNQIIQYNFDIEAEVIYAADINTNISKKSKNKTKKIKKNNSFQKKNNSEDSKPVQTKEYLSHYSQLNVDSLDKDNFLPISKLKLGVITTSATITQKEIVDIINHGINSNIFDRYIEPNKNFVGLYRFISEFKKSNFILLNKEVFEYCKNENFASNELFFSNELYDLIFEELKKAIFNKHNINYLIAAKGDFGSAKLMEKLYTMSKPTYDKLLIGFSDVTALHLFFSQELNWQTIHGPNIVSIKANNLKNDLSQDSIRKLIFLLTSKKPVKINIGLIPINELAIKSEKNIKGLVTGGNATVIQTSIGTKWEIKSKDRILFLEDVNLSYYEVDRLLTHLKQARVFDNVKAIVFGAFFNGEKNLSLKDFKSLAQMIDVPIFVTDKIGHGKYNYPFVINLEGDIFKNKEGDFVFEQIYQNHFTSKIE